MGDDNNKHTMMIEPGPFGESPAAAAPPAAAASDTPPASPGPTNAHGGGAFVTHWLAAEENRPDCKFRVFLFPHSGASPSVFQGWTPHFPDSVEVLAVAIPGRGRRHHEPSFHHLPSLVSALLEDLAAHLDKPYALFGHSGGALLALETAREIQRRGLVGPTRVCVSGLLPPAHQGNLLSQGLEDDESLASLVSEWGGLPAQLADDPEALAHFLAPVRADLAMYNDHLLAHWHGAAGGDRRPEKLQCAVSVFGGKDDAAVPVQDLQGWVDEFETDVCDQFEFEGGHFYFEHAGSLSSLLDTLSALAETDLQVALATAHHAALHWPNHTHPYPSDATLHELFREQAQKTPHRLALYDEGTRITFQELDEMTDALAQFLVWKGVARDVPVGLYMERCAQFVVGYLAALKASGCYMPLEIVYPPDLLARVLDNAKPAVVLTKGLYEHRLPAAQCRFSMDGDWVGRLRSLCVPPIPESHLPARPDDLAYIVMSSGTTGVPKGICCPHRGAVHSYDYRYRNFPYAADERDACNVFFVWEVVRPLLQGLPAFIIPDDKIYDPDAVIHYLLTHAITRILFTPSLWQLVLDTIVARQDAAQVCEQLAQHLKIVWLCGEVVTAELCNRSVGTLPTVRFLNLYSVSECHDVSVQDLAALPAGPQAPKYAPCGRIFENVRCYILDDGLVPVPNGVAGELFVSGPVLARGYLNQPEMTARRFLPNPLNGDELPEHALMYRTGDRARFLPDGRLELMGRCDFMVKIRGYSVNVGAVEAALAQYPLVSTSCVLTEGAEGDDKRLVAYVVPSEWDKIPTATEIQHFLEGCLPHYAIPSAYVLMQMLPINDATGKLDRKRLPSTDQATLLPSTTLSSASQPPPRALSPTEARLKAIWVSVLRIDAARIDAASNFYNVGGHSLGVARVVAKVREEFGVKVKVAAVARAPTLEAMAALVDSEGTPQEVPSRASPTPGVDLQDEVRLDSSIFPAPTRKHGYARVRATSFQRLPTRIFLTGATGYLGSFLLLNLLRSSDRLAVFCMVRAQNEEEGFARLERSLRQHGLWEEACERGVDVRVEVVCGDLQKPLLGLNDAEFRHLAGQIDMVVHNGAEVNLVKSYSALKAANVLGTHEVLRLAVTNGPLGSNVKPVVFVSSNGVFPQSQAECAEDDALLRGDLLEDGYGQSKWVAEKLCLEARNRGLPVVVMRPGNMAPAVSQSERFNEHDFVVLLLRACKRLGAVPTDVDWELDLTPVDWAAAAIARLVTKEPFRVMGQVVHVQNHQRAFPVSLAFDALEDHLSAHGQPLRRLAMPDWAALVHSKAEADQEEGGVLGQLALGLESFVPYLSSPPHFRCEQFTQLIGEAAPGPCPQVDKQVLRAWVDRL